MFCQINSTEISPSLLPKLWLEKEVKMMYTYESFENLASKPSEGIFPTKKLFETLLQKKNKLVSK